MESSSDSEDLDYTGEGIKRRKKQKLNNGSRSKFKGHLEQLFNYANIDFEAAISRKQTPVTQFNSESDVDLDEYPGPRRKNLTKRVRPGDKKSSIDLPFDIPPDVRTSTRLASKAAVYQFSSSEDDYEYAPALQTAEIDEDRPAIDVILTYRKKEGACKCCLNPNKLNSLR